MAQAPFTPTSKIMEPPAKQAGPAPDAKGAASARIADTTAAEQVDMASDAAFRRAEVEAKTMREKEQPTPAERIREQERLAALREAAGRASGDGAEKAAAAGPQEHMFLSPFKDLRLYIDLGRTEVEPRTNVTIPRFQPIQFRNGVFRTTNARIVAGIRRHPRYGTHTFREELNARTVALRAQIAAGRDQLRSATYAGPTASTDGMDTIFNAQDGELAGLENNLFNY